jgi:putative toxin-antitoxin system antitoxin component (TIGR02293 family)
MATRFSLKEYRAAPPLARAKAVARGFPAKALRDLVADRTVTLADVAKVVGPRRTLQLRLAGNERLTLDESDRLARLIAAVDLATATFGDRKTAMEWMSKPKRRLEGSRPLDLLKTDAGTRLVEEILEQARHGFAA